MSNALEIMKLHPSLQEGLGKNEEGYKFTLIAAYGDKIITDSEYVPKIRLSESAVIKLNVGDECFLDYWTKGYFVKSLTSGKTHLCLYSGENIEIEGHLNEFIDEIQTHGKKNKFERLLQEDKIIAGARSDSYSDQAILLEVALADEGDWQNILPVDPYEAYKILIDVGASTGQIVEANYEGGKTVIRAKSPYDKAQPVNLPEDILKAMKINEKELYSTFEFKKLTTKSLHFIRNSCYRPS